MTKEGSNCARLGGQPCATASGAWRGPLKRAIACAATLAAATLFGCTTPAPIVLHDPVGPWQPRAAVDDGPGQLMVYSATRVTTADDSEYPVHTPYTIYVSDNKVFRDVRNTAGLFSQAPSKVSLPPGRYQVRALAADAGSVIVPVVIVPHETTIVDLDGTVLPQQDTRLSQNTTLPQDTALPHQHTTQAVDDAHLVRLPNGRVIGAQPQ
jgi:hypothetical protein